MSNDVYAATATRRNIGFQPARGVANVGAFSDRALPCPLRSQRGLDFPERQTIHHIRFRQPSFARNTDPEPQILETFDAVGVRIDYALHSSLFSARPPAPVEIKPFRSRVKLDPSAGTRRHIENCRNVDLVRLAFQQQSAGRMRE